MDCGDSAHSVCAFCAFYLRIVYVLIVDGVVIETLRSNVGGPTTQRILLGNLYSHRHLTNMNLIVVCF